MVTNQENATKRKKHSNNTSGLKGVSWSSRYGKWQARIMIHGKAICLGLYTNKYHAYCVYCIAAHFYHGKFAKE